MIDRSLTTLTLVFVMFFITSGGAFSTEGLVADVGPGMALLLLLLVPVLWSIPETLIIGELASMLPVEGGYYRWVQRAFGDFWAFQNGWVTWLYSLVDMAIYPVLFNAYLGHFFPELTRIEQWGISLLVIWGAAAVNLRGALPVGRMSLAAGVVVLSGFGVLTLLALPKIGHAPWHPFLKEGQGVWSSLGVGVSIALWNYTGWDNASTVQGEVRNASATYPRALAITLPLVMLGYFAPLLATLGASDWTAWQEGGWPAIAREIGGVGWGEMLGAWLSLAGLISTLTMFSVLLLSYSRMILVMAEDGLLPRHIAETDARGTPRGAVLLSATFYSIFALVPFGSLVVSDMLLYAPALALEFGALIRLRRVEPELRGAFRMPIGRKAIMALSLIPLAILATVAILSLFDGENALPALIGTVVGIALGPFVYLWRVRVRSRRGDSP